MGRRTGKGPPPAWQEGSAMWHMPHPSSGPGTQSAFGERSPRPVERQVEVWGPRGPWQSSWAWLLCTLPRQGLLGNGGSWEAPIPSAP